MRLLPALSVTSELSPAPSLWLRNRKVALSVPQFGSISSRPGSIASCNSLMAQTVDGGVQEYEQISVLNR